MLITEAYKNMNKQLHLSCYGFGSGGKKIAWKVPSLIDKYQAKSILDYGSGKGNLKTALKQTLGDVKFYQYEPAFDIDQRTPSDIVICRDVMEHIEPECLEDVLQDLRRLTLKCFYVIISTKQSSDVFPDGTNAHRIVKNPEWWEERIKKYFKIISKEKEYGRFTIEAN